MDPFFWGGSQPFYRSVNKTEIVSGCVINRGVVLVDLEKWKSQNITGAIEDLVRLHLTKGHRGKKRYFFGQEIHDDLSWFADDPVDLLITLLICCYFKEYEYENSIYICSWIELFKKTTIPKGGFDRHTTSGQFGSSLDFKTVCHRSCRPDSKCTDAIRCGMWYGPLQSTSFFNHHFKLHPGTTRKVYFTIRRFRRHQENHSPLWLHINSIHPICKYLT